MFLGELLHFRRAHRCFFFICHGHYMRYNPCIGTLPEFGAALAAT